MDFDRELRARAKGEDCPVPKGFEERLKERLESLPQRGRRRFPRVLMVAALVAVLCLGGVIAAPAVLEMAQGTIDYFEIPAEFRELSSRAEYERFNSTVGASVTHSGITVALENVAIDDTFLTLFYTITGEEPLPKGQGEDRSAERSVERMLLGLRAKADGKYLDNWGRQIELHLVDDYTARVMERQPIMRVLPNVVELELYSDQLFFDTPGKWYFTLAVDKSAPAVESLVAEPDFYFEMGKSRLTVEKVSVSPLGGGMVLYEAGSGIPWIETPGPFRNFVLRDDRGNYLAQRRNGMVSGWSGLSNFIEFYGGRTDMKSLTIVPFSCNRGEAGAHPVEGALTELPLTDDTRDGYTMRSLELGENKATAVFETRGLLPYISLERPDFALLDASGEYADLGNGYTDQVLDRETGLWTVTQVYPQATEEQWAKITGVMMWQSNGYTLLEEQAVTIPLQS